MLKTFDTGIVVSTLRPSIEALHSSERMSNTKRRTGQQCCGPSVGLFEKRHRNNSFAFGTSGLAALVVSSSMDFDIGICTLVEGYSNYYYYF